MDFFKKLIGISETNQAAETTKPTQDSSPPREPLDELPQPLFSEDDTRVTYEESAQRNASILSYVNDHDPSQGVNQSTTEEISPYIKNLCEYSLLHQYQRLQDNAPSGVYVVPSRDSLYQWHGVIFVARSFYSQGIFRFVIDIPQSYPEDMPVVRFVSEVYNPMVGDDGVLDMRLYGTWQGHHYLTLVLAYLKKCFYKAQLWDDAESLPGGPLNPNASAQRQASPADFIKECRRCVDLSVFESYKPPRDHYSEAQTVLDTPVVFSRPAPVHDTIIQRLFDEAGYVRGSSAPIQNERPSNTHHEPYLTWFVDGHNQLQR